MYIGEGLSGPELSSDVIWSCLYYSPTFIYAYGNINTDVTQVIKILQHIKRNKISL